MSWHTVDINGLHIGRNHPTRIMGAINLSPESFYGKSVVTEKEDLVRVVSEMENQGADLIDVGGASTAPKHIYGTKEVSLDEELKRVKKAMKIIQDSTKLPISIDTTSSKVAKVALDLGAGIVNDVSGLRDDQKMAKIVAQWGIPMVIMANCGEPCMGVSESIEALRHSIQIASKTGILPNRIVVDPGIGFGKPTEIDCNLLKNLNRFTMLGHPVLVGVSRKAFIGSLLGQPNPEDRLLGTVAATSIAVVNGANIILAHDIEAARMAAKIGESLRKRLLSPVDNIELIDMYNEREAEVVIDQIGVGADIRRPLSKKAVTLALLIRELKTPAALIVKQEMLAVGGDAAYHHDTIDSGIESTDVLLMGTHMQIDRFVKKLLSMSYFGLHRIGRAVQEILTKREQELG